MHPDSPAHEGYALVPPVLQELPNLKRLSMQVNSGQSVDLTPASGIPDVNLALTLAHYEQTPFNRCVRVVYGWCVGLGFVVGGNLFAGVEAFHSLLNRLFVMVVSFCHPNCTHTHTQCPHAFAAAAATAAFSFLTGCPAAWGV